MGQTSDKPAIVVIVREIGQLYLQKGRQGDIDDDDDDDHDDGDDDGDDGDDDVVNICCQSCCRSWPTLTGYYSANL